MSGGPDAAVDERHLSAAVFPAIVWISLVLSITLPRSLPDLPNSVTLSFRALGVLGAAWLIVRKPLAQARPGVRNGLLRGDLLVLAPVALVPATGIVLAAYRGEIDDTINHLASLLALIAASQLDHLTRLRSMLWALLSLVLASLAMGLVYPPAVVPGSRSFLGALYGGRLDGILQTPNVLGQFSALMIVLALLALRGGQRVAVVTIGIVAILAASSQTALIAVAAALVVFATVTAWQRRQVDVVFAAYTIAAVAAGVTFYYVENYTFLGPKLAAWVSQVNFSSRTNIWTLLLQQDVPFLGIGQQRLGEIIRMATIEGATGVSTAHNAWLEAYLRDGAPGIVALSAAALSVVLLALTRQAGLALVPVAVFIVESLTEVTPTHVPFYTFYFILVGACLEVQRRDALLLNREQRDAERPAAATVSRPTQGWSGDRVVDRDVADESAGRVVGGDLLADRPQRRRVGGVTERGP